MPWNDPISLTIISENWFSMQGFSNLPRYGTMTGELITCIFILQTYMVVVSLRRLLGVLGVFVGCVWQVYYLSSWVVWALGNNRMVRSYFLFVASVLSLSMIEGGHEVSSLFMTTHQM
jgi:hypothetical protein